MFNEAAKGETAQPTGRLEIVVRDEVLSKTVCPPLPVRWLALHCASEGCSGGPSRSSSQEDEPWRIIEKHLSESMLRS